MTPDIRHFKLNGGSEILADVIEYDSAEDAAMVVRNVLELHYLYNPETHLRIVTMRPFMMGQVDVGLFQTINSEQIIAIATPTPEVIDSYMEVLKEYIKPDDEDQVFENALLHVDEDELDSYEDIENEVEFNLGEYKWDKNKLH